MAPTVPIEYTGRKEPKTYSQRSGVVMMGNAKKFSKGNFVPDYRHEVDTMAESEGFGSSGKVDTEMTASEGSCAPKRKVISLNVDGYDQYGTSLQILSLSKMSESERKGLMMKLKSELEQVKLLQKKIVSLDLNGQQRPQVESFQRPVEVSTSLGKKRAPPGRNGPRAKRPTARHLESVRQAGPPSTSIAMLMKQCETLLNRLMLHQYGWVFNTPVDVVKLNIPDYFNVIKHPMDLGTVKSKLLSGEYLNPLGFAADVRLTFSNSMTYNPPGNDVYIMADTLAKYFEVRWKLIEKKVSGNIDAPVLSTSSVHIETETPNPVPPSKKKKITPLVDNMVKQEPVKPIMTDVEKHKLSTELEALLAELPESIIDFLKKQSQNASQTDEDEIEIDLDALSDDTLLALRKLLDDHLLDRQKMQGKAEPCEMELNNSGFSNSPVQPLEGNDPIEDDVDIGGNDPPISSNPPVEIEKDTALRNSKCSSSSSSSSKSGSSSSDSDSGSSSCSKSDGARASIPAVSTMENIGSGANIEQKGNDPGDSDIGNRSLNGLNQVAQNFQPQVVASEGEGCQEGESAPPGRQVSPDKLYRAALLRSRFADTIIKAQEKTLEKVEKQDPRKLHLEREELERRRIEEKARLQAEAKAAEEARRKAEAEAAAEARRKRELERQAARQALQQMEKTVDINENCRFMEDLELLRAAPVEQIFIDDASPDHSVNGLGSFKFQGNSNPLEQLGLYMKADDEEEEEGDPECVPDAVDDMEEEEGEPNSVPDVVNDMEEGEGEPESVLEAVNGMEEGEGEPGTVPDAVNGMEEGEGEPKSVPDAVDHAEEEDEPKSVLADDAKEGEPKSVSAAVVDAVEGEI